MLRRVRLIKRVAELRAAQVSPQVQANIVMCSIGRHGFWELGKGRSTLEEWYRTYMLTNLKITHDTNSLLVEHHPLRSLRHVRRHPLHHLRD
jgi:hypothetical protein